MLNELREDISNLSRRLDRLTRQVERLERDQTITVEALGLFIRAWLTATPALAPSAQQAAQDKGRERYENFLETLARRVQQGRSLAREVSEDVAASQRAELGVSAEAPSPTAG